METKPGHIRILIDKKVYFEPDGLEKPNRENCNLVHGKYYAYAMKKYEALKKPIEVENVFLGKLVEEWFYDDEVGYEIGYKVMNNQPCKAEIKDNKATIIELIK